MLEGGGDGVGKEPALVGGIGGLEGDGGVVGAGDGVAADVERGPCEGSVGGGCGGGPVGGAGGPLGGETEGFFFKELIA